MKKVLVVVFAVAISIGAVANAQVPNVQIYFDEGLKYSQKNCPTAPLGSVADTLHVVANNFGIWMNAIEYSVIYPAQLMWVGDIDESLSGALSIGSSPYIGDGTGGVGIAFTPPRNGFVQLEVQKVVVVWMCNDCGPANQDVPIIVVPYEASGLVRAVEWPNLNTVIGVGMTSLICATTPVQETTWGQIKALYD